MKKRTRITAKMEQKMQELRAQGKSAKEIAAVVGVSETAVRTHTTGIVVPEDETGTGRSCAEDVHRG